MALDDRATGTPALLTESSFSQIYREHLEKAGILNGHYRAQKFPEGTVALPVLRNKVNASVIEELVQTIAPGSSCQQTTIKNPVLSKRAQVQSPAQKLRKNIFELLEHLGISWGWDVDYDIPHSWQRHGDLVVFNEDCFKNPEWGKLGNDLWEKVASSLGAKRLAKQGHILADGERSPTVTLLLGNNGWVEHIDNGIRYTFDISKCMFSAGNISEKQRVALLSCHGEVVVDLYAGIGYFTLPYLVHAGASFVHACEWNHDAVIALQKNLLINKVSDKCQIHEGDNRQLILFDVADRVNLGLIPTSEPGYTVACRALRKDTGGILHIHQNVDSFKRHAKTEKEDFGGKMAWMQWAEQAEMQITDLLKEIHQKNWHTRILRVEQIKSYAPHVDHVVMDLDCRPDPVI
ncbi:hypothetical protein GDO86_015007 [Hymenochirus boettgeri]|uniref:tRNA wybutosine-synthesizing protein 2 homolog n=1 Tax=Hymenochirus boettgeri TaxID=247094 RepID=A0A8T2JW56_9PIPI|nr:hypothetical protein GDO86_015007 [Hymenochirus boettgeri]